MTIGEQRCETRRMGGKPFHPILARTQTVHRPIGPTAYDCVKIIVVRDGSAMMYSEFGQKQVRVGDVVLLGANTLCGSAPEVNITVTTIYLDTDYVIDQVFWQYAAVLSDRLHAQQFAETPASSARAPVVATTCPREKSEAATRTAPCTGARRTRRAAPQ